MRCLRCGYCCINYCVMVVKDASKELIAENMEFHAGNGRPCRHLRGPGPGDYTCAIHDKPWYKETPCFAFTQVEDNPDTPCRIGVYVLNRK